MPENEAVIAEKLGHKNIWDLISAFTSSAEFQHRSEQRYSDYYNFAWRRLAPPLAIDCGVQTDEIYAQLENHIRQTWNKLGEEEPFFSVITDSRFLMQENPNRQDFYDLGKVDAELIRSTLARSGISTERLNTCVEYGCGVGRATWQLARLFKKVNAYDSSAAHINEGRKWISECGISNVEFRSVNGLSSLYGENHDFWFSRLVLQHNPPPLILRILTEALQHLAPGGCAMFQVPIYIKNYKFDVREYLRTSNTPGHMEVHCVPQHALIKTIEAAGCEVLEIVEDQDLGSPHTMASNTMLVKNLKS